MPWPNDPSRVSEWRLATWLRPPVWFADGAQTVWSGPVGRYLRRFGYSGLWFALIFFCWSLTPSLLPRPWYIQSFESGIALVVGYGVGVVLGWGVRRTVLRRPSARTRQFAWIGLGVATVVAVPVMLLLHSSWQRSVRRLVHASQPGTASYFRILALALAVAFAIIALARALRALAGWIAARVLRFLPVRIAQAVAAVLVAVGFVFLLNGLLARVLLDAASTVFRAADNGNKPGVVRTHDPLKSGSDASLVAWDSMGKEGRAFVSLGPTQQEISQFSQRPAQDPVRVFVGLRSADSLRAEAALAVRELERTGGFDRQILAVATTTGRGWVDPQVSDPLEFMYDGDTATVAMQYSYLPSWLSFLVDHNRAQEAGRELFNQVYARWEKLPAGHRPKLLVYGESLGAYGSQAAFSGTDDLDNRTSGVLWVGPPEASSLTKDFTRNRDRGSPERLPVYQRGETVRFFDRPSAINGAGWQAPRVAVLQHASDPVVWWSWDLLFHRPAWLHEKRGPDVSTRIRWYPVVSFWQVTGDLLFSQGATPGHGHRYGEECARAWTVVAPPPSWNAAKTDALVRLMVQREADAKARN